MADKFALVMRSKATHGTDRQTIEVGEGQDAKQEAQRIADGYGAEVVALARKPDAIAAPELEHDKMMLDKYKQKVIPRGRIERRVMANLLHFLDANGFKPVLLDDTEEDTKVSTMQEVMELAFNLDECRVYFHHTSTEAKPRHCIYFVFGNDGWDIAADWDCPDHDADGWKAAMEAFNPEEYV